MNEASAQYSIQQQAHALLQMCSEENEVDEIEAERIILLAGIIIMQLRLFNPTPRKRHYKGAGFGGVLSTSPTFL